MASLHTLVKYLVNRKRSIEVIKPGCLINHLVYHDVNRYKDGQPYTLDTTRSTILRSGTMLITEIVPGDAGLYRCTATIDNEAVHATARVLVRGTCKVVLHYSNKSVEHLSQR